MKVVFSVLFVFLILLGAPATSGIVARQFVSEEHAILPESMVARFTPRTPTGPPTPDAPPSPDLPGPQDPSLPKPEPGTTLLTLGFFTVTLTGVLYALESWEGRSRLPR